MKKIKMMLALLAALVCSGAWAAGLESAVVYWDRDFDVATKVGTDGNTFTFDKNGNTVVNGCLKISGSVGGLISIPSAARNNSYTVLIKYSGLTAQSGKSALLAIDTTNSGNANEGLYVADGATKLSAYYVDGSARFHSYSLTDMTVPSKGYVQLAFSSGSNLWGWTGEAVLNASGGGAASGLAFSNTQIETFALGGPTNTTGDTPAAWNGLVVEAVAIFKGNYWAVSSNNQTVFPFANVCDDVSFFAEVTSETPADFSELTWRNASGEITSEPTASDAVGVFGTGKINVPNSRTGKVCLGANVTAVVPAASNGWTTPMNGKGKVLISNGVVKTGAKDVFGGLTLVVEKGAAAQIEQYANNQLAYDVVLNGGTYQSGTAGDAHGRMVKSLRLTANSVMKGVANGKQVGIGYGGSANSTLDLNGYELEVSAARKGDRIAFDKVQMPSAGTLHIKQGNMFIHCSDITAPAGTKVIIDADAVIEGSNRTLTVPELVYNGTTTTGFETPSNVIVTDKFSGTGTLPKLKLQGATVVFPSTVAAEATYNIPATTLDSASTVKSGEHMIQVGELMVKGTLTLDASAKTVKYTLSSPMVLAPAGNAIKLTDINAFAGESAVTVEMPDNSYLDINTDSVTPASVTVNNAGKLTVVKTTSTGWGTISELPSGITVSDSSQVVFDDGSVKAEYFGQQPSYWSNVYAGPTTSSEAGDASATGQWWKRSSDSKPLYTSSSNWNPTLFDGNLIPLVQVGADGYKTINAPLSSNNGWEGWELRVGAVNGVKINVAKLVKMQGNIAGFIGVDATSKLVINEYSNGNNRPSMVFDVASPNGVEILNIAVGSRNEDDGAFLYNLSGDGSVSVGALLDRGASHKISAVGIALGEGRYRAIKERKIVGGTVTKANFVYGFTDTATVTVTDKQGVQGSVCANAALTLLDAPGTAAIIKKADGLYVQYIGYSDETPSEYMWKYNKATGNWSDADAWTGVLDTTGATHSWSELSGSTTPVTVFIDANETSEITIDSTINATKVVLTNTSTDPKPFAFNTTYEGEGGSQTVPENVKLTAPVDATAFNGELGLRGVITGEVIVGPATQIVFVAPTADQQTTAYDYTLAGYETAIEVRGPGTFRVPSTMYTRPFNVMPMKVNGEYSGEAGYILYAIAQNNTITVDDVISGEGGVKKSGLGELRLSGVNTYTGGTIVMGGTIQARTGTANTTAVTSFGVGDVDVRDGATLDIYGRYLANQIYIAGDGVGNNGALINTGANLGKNLGDGNNWKISLRANSSWGGNYFTHFGSNADVALGGYTFTKKGSNLFPLNGTAGIKNGKIVVEAGEFQNNGGVNNLSTVDLEIKNGATLNMNGGTSLTVKSFKCEGSITGTNAKLIIAENGTLNESSADIGKLELKNNVTVVAAANKKIAVTGEFTCGEAVNVNASAKTEESDVTLFTMPSEADAIALAAKISLVGDAEHIVVAKGANVCLAPAAVSEEEAFKEAVATAGDVTLGGNLTLTQTIDVADGVTIILGEYTISGGTLNLASGTISFHVEQGKSTTISSTITGAAKIQKTGGGELTMSANNGNFTGSWEVVGGDLKGSQKLAYGHDVNGDDALTFKVGAGATLYVDKMDDISYNLVMAGGTVKNGSGNNIDLNHRQIRKMTLESDSRVEGANFGFVPGGHSNGKITLDGHTLTVAMASDNKFAFDGMTDDDVGGVIKVVSGKIGNASVQNEAVLSHTQIVLEGGAFECERQMTVKSVKVVSAGENSGTLKVKECVEGALAMPKLTLDDNATIKLADSQSITVSTALTLGANLKVNLTGITTAVGGEMTVLTAPSSFSFESTTLACVNNEGAADNKWILKAKGNTLKAYRNAEVGGVCPNLSNSFQTFMVSTTPMTIEDFAKNYTLAANFTGGNISGSPKPGTMIDAHVANDIFTAQFQVLNSEMKWRNIEVKIVNEDSLYKAQIKNGKTGYENSSGAEDTFGKTGKTERGGYQLSSFTATPGAMTEDFSFDGTIENGVVKSPTGWLTSFSYAYSTSNTAIGPEPNTVVCKTTSHGPYGDIAFGSKSNFTVSFYANALDVDSASTQAMLLCLGSGSKGVYLKKTTEGKIAMDLYNASSADYASDDIENGKGFHLYTITRDAGKVYNLYIDGKKIAAQYKDYAPANGFQIAAPYGNNSNFAVGINLTVAGLFGYDRVLSDYQIAELAKLYPAVPMAKAEGVDKPIRGVDASELIKKYNELKPGSAEEATSINSNGVNGLPLWKSDILGLDPTDENSTKVIIKGAQTTEAGSMKLLTGIKPNPEIVTVTLKSGTTAACDDTDVTPMADDGSFTVTLPTGDGKVKYYKLTYEFPSAE